MKKRQTMLSRAFILFISSIVLIIGLSDADASPLMQPVQPTEEPVSGTETPEPVILTAVPIPTEVIDPEALILEDSWQSPINLSRSGGTSDSQLVIDSNGTSHVLWLDQVEGFGYTYGTGDQWSKSEASEFPFYTRRLFPDLRDSEPTPLFNPKLVADGRGQIYAFWLGEDGILYYSTVPAGSFTDYGSWIPRTAVTDKALAINASMGADGRIHLVYIRREDSETRPAGVYYRQVNPTGVWNDPILLYASRYLRSVPADLANIQVVASDSGAVYVAWDDTLKKQVYFASSSNNGLNWDSVQEIDRRAKDDQETAVGPANIMVGTIAEHLHLTWIGGHEQGQNCSQYVSTSNDGGATWNDLETLSSLPRCFTTTQFLVADETLFLLGTIVEEGAEQGSLISTSYLLAWDGIRWSEPQIQEPLNRFSNPETNQAVRLLCHTGIGQGNVIRLLGCDSAEGGDIWLLNRETGAVEEWFPPPPVWQGPVEILISNSKPLETHLVSSSDGSVHNFWNEENSPWIYHAKWDGGKWSSGQEIIRSPVADIVSLAVASANDRLYLAWEDSALGIQFSEASISSPSQWTDPVSPVNDQPSASSPSIVADAGGNVFLAYAEQLNEARGVYLIHSADAGATWSAPVQVFDGPAAGWDMVDKPILTQTDNGQMHLTWTRNSLPPDSIPIGLAYSRSEDLGQSWAEGKIIVEAQSYWNEIIGTGERFVHRFWTEEGGGRDGTWHSYSLDGGLTWSQSEQVIRFSNKGGLAAAIDPVDRPHLLAVENGQLANLVWDGGVWVEDANLETVLNDNGYLAAATNLGGALVASYVDIPSAEGDQGQENRLYSMWRSLDLPSELPTPLPTLTPTQPAITPIPTTTQEPTATVFFSTEREQSGIGEIPGMGGLPVSMDLILSFLPVLLIVGIGIIIGIRIIRKR